MRTNSMFKLCGNYYPAVKVALDFLLSEKKKREKERSIARSYKKSTIIKISNTTIDEIMSASFGPSPRYMSLVRQCYSRSKKIDAQKYPHWEFNSNRLRETCAGAKIDIPEKKIELIQVLAELTLTVGDILDENSSLVKTDIKSQAEKNIRAFNFIFQTNYGIPYWKSFFKYFRSLDGDEEGLILYLIANLPDCDIESITSWIHQIQNIYAPIPTKERCVLEKCYSFLQDYCSELLRFNQSQEGKQEDVFRPLLAEDLFYAAVNIDTIRRLSQKKLRAADVFLIYLVKTQLTYDYKQVFLGELREKLGLVWYY